MSKTISAALLAVSFLAAPAIAAPYKSADVPMIKAAPFSSKVMNASAHWGRHHRRHHRWYFHHRHHRHHHHWR